MSRSCLPAWWNITFWCLQNFIKIVNRELGLSYWSPAETEKWASDGWTCSKRLSSSFTNKQSNLFTFWRLQNLFNFCHCHVCSFFRVSLAHFVESVPSIFAFKTVETTKGELDICTYLLIFLFGNTLITNFIPNGLREHLPTRWHEKHFPLWLAFRYNNGIVG